jgi:RNA polymerase sigma-70 factor (ECF subfamily)
VLDDVAQFYTTRRRNLLAQAFAIVRNHALAEDLTQEAFARLVSEIKSGNTIRSAVKWTSTVLRNLALNHMAHSKVVSRIMEPDSQYYLDTIPEGAISTEEAYLAEESKIGLKNVLLRLTPLERECTLMFAEGHSYNEIAFKKALTYGVAVDMVRRSLRKLRKQLPASQG